MIKYIIRRTLWSIPVLLLLTFLVFVLMRAIPGGPFDFAGDKKLPKAVVRNLERRHHLDWPMGWQFVSYVFGDDVAGAVCSALPLLPDCETVAAGASMGVSRGIIRGDLGMAMRQRGRTVNEIVGDSLPISVQLGILSMLVAVGIGIPLGTLAALKQNTWLDYTSTFFAIAGVSIPNLVMGPLLIWIFALKLNWFPVSTWGARPPFILGFIPKPDLNFWSHAVLPTLALGTGLSATIARLTRASLLQVIRQDYIRTARAKGLPERAVIITHALKNSMIPVATVLGPMFAAVATGTFVVEQIFGLPGMGKHFVQSIGNRDYPIIMGVTLIYAIFLVIANMMVDITYAWLDPRISYE